MFHRLVYLRVLERVQVDLSYLFGTMAERLADDGGGYSRPFENGCIGVSSNIGCERNRQVKMLTNNFEIAID